MKHKGTLLIFAYECYPYNRTGSAIGGQRPYQFAKNLSERGWKVIVLCCDREKRRVLNRENFNLTLQEVYESYQEALNKNNLCVCPLPSLKFHGWADFLWSISVSKGPGGTYKGKCFLYSLVRKMATFYNQLRHGDYSWSWVPVAEAFAQQLLRDYKVDVILGEHGPDAGIVLADSFSKKYDIPWIADFRDPVLWPFKGLLGLLYKPVVKRIVRSAEATINVNPYWSSLDQQLFGKPSYTILNGYDKRLFDQIPAHHFPFFTISYFGSFSDEFQDIQPSLRAIAEFIRRANDPSDVVLFYRGLQQEEFIDRCNASGISSRYLDVQGFVKREETIASMKGSQVLLIYTIPSYKANDRYKKKGFYPGKIFEYIGAAKPVLCIPSDNGLLESLIHAVKIGKVTSSLEDAVFFIQQEYMKWTKLKRNEPLQLEYAGDYTREKQARELEVILLKIINEGKKGV